ncbi:hypothetical protein KI387_033519, partial [Taxus chinensis]
MDCEGRTERNSIDWGQREGHPDRNSHRGGSVSCQNILEANMLYYYKYGGY